MSLTEADRQFVEKVREDGAWPRLDGYASDPDSTCDRLVGIIDYLDSNGHVPLPTSAPSRGPRTSQAAADSIDNLSARHFAVYCALQEMGPMTDEELVDRYNSHQDRDFAATNTPQTPQSLRSRRHELVLAGHVEWTSLLRPTRTGRQAKVWQAK